MSDMADLVVRFSERGAKNVINNIDKVTSSGTKATMSLKAIALGATAATAAVAGIGLATVAIKDATVKFESLQAGIQTAVGSATEAQTVFKILQDFTSNTPYDIEKVTTAFTQLVNYGLTPSERALKSYGNTASAMRKDISQMVEAVADAVTGEFERLKEFGIKSKNNGDTIAFTFRGVKTEVKNNAEEIEKYLIELGENNFGDAMLNQSKTLGGAISSLESAWENMWYEVGQMGFGDAIRDGVELGTESIKTFTEMLQSGEIEAYLDIIGAYFGSTFDTIGEGVTTVANWMSDQWDKHGDDVVAVVAIIADAFASVPMTVRYWLQQAVVIAASFVDKIQAYGEAVRSALNPFDGVSIKQSKANLDARLANIKEAKQSSVSAIKDEYAENRKAVEKAILDAKKLTAERIKGNKKVKESTGDRLAKYAIKAPKGKDDEDDKDGKKGKKSKATDDAKKKADKAAREAERAKQKVAQEFERVRQSLETETETAQREYKERNEKIIAATAEGSTQRSELIKRSEEKLADDLYSIRNSGELASLKKSLMKEEDLIKQSYEERQRTIDRYAPDSDKADLSQKSKEMYEKEQKELADRRERSRQSLMEGLLTEEQEIILSYERRKQAILDATELTETEKNDLVTKLGEQHKANLDYLMLDQIDSITSNMSSSLSVMTDMLAASGKKSNFLYKAMLMAQKAAAIPQMIMSTEMGATKALELGPVAGPIASGAVRALGYAAIGTVAGQAIAGLFDQGGMVPSGKVGIVGERGPELVKGPAIVTSRQSTAGMLGKGGGNQVNVTVHNNAPVNVRTEDDGKGNIQMIIDEVSDKVEKRIAGSISRGEGDVTKAMQSSYGLKRGAM